jgi:taurine dioxygenase
MSTESLPLSGARIMRSATPAAERWPFEVHPLTPALGARIVGVDLAKDIDDDLFDAIYRAFLRYQVLLFGPLDLPPAGRSRSARRFGEVQIHVMNQYHADGFPELYRLSNLDENGKPNGRIPTGARSRGTPTARGRASPARRRSSTARSWPARAATRISATCTARTSASTRTGNRASPAARGAQPRLLAHAPAWRGSDDRSAAARDAARRPPDRAHASGDGPRLRLSRRSRGIRRRHAYDEGRALIEDVNARAVHPTSPTSITGSGRAAGLGQPLPAAPRDRATIPFTQGRVVRRCTVLGEVPERRTPYRTPP